MPDEVALDDVSRSVHRMRGKARVPVRLEVSQDVYDHFRERAREMGSGGSPTGIERIMGLPVSIVEGQHVCRPLYAEEDWLADTQS